MASKILAGVALGCVLCACSGCSVAMAAKSRKGANVGVAQRGVTRGEVEEELGQPETSTLTPEGEWCTYKYEYAKEGSAGRAVAHGVMDVLTLGIWEAVGTPVEAISDDKYGRIQVLYDTSTDAVIRTRKLE